MIENNDELRFSFSIEQLNALGSESMKSVLSLLDNYFKIKPDFIERSDKPKYPIEKYSDKFVLEALDTYRDIVEFYDKDRMICINVMQNIINTRSGFSVEIKLNVAKEISSENLKQLFLDIVRLLPVNYASCHFRINRSILNDDVYELIGDRTFFASGLFWLNFFGPSEEAKQGGKALETNPHATEIKRLENGLFIQVGESPFDCYTEKGRERLINATKAMPPATW